MNNAAHLFKSLSDMEVTPCQCKEFSITPGMTPESETAAPCVCSREERIIRAYAKGISHRRMTPAERAWCIHTADRAGEGRYDRIWLAGLEDQELAKVVLQAWKDYVS